MNERLQSLTGYTITPVELNESKLTYECFILEISPPVYIGIIAFYGKYGYGSTGRDDALFIEQRVQEFHRHWDIGYSGFIVDFSDLDYIWGNELAEVYLNHYELDSPPFCVIPPPEDERRHKAFQWAMAVGKYEVFTNLKSAVEAMENHISKGKIDKGIESSTPSPKPTFKYWLSKISGFGKK